MFYFHHYLGKWSNLTSIFFQMGWFNHHLVMVSYYRNEFPRTETDRTDGGQHLRGWSPRETPNIYASRKLRWRAPKWWALEKMYISFFYKYGHFFGIYKLNFWGGRVLNMWCMFGCKTPPRMRPGNFTCFSKGIPTTRRWAPTRYKWDDNSYKWPYKWVNGDRICPHWN